MTIQLLQPFNGRSPGIYALGSTEEARLVALPGNMARYFTAGMDGRNPVFSETEKAALQASVSGDGKFRRGSIRRFDALYRWSGVGGTPFNKGGGSSLAFCANFKMEVEAPFHAVRLLLPSVQGNAINNNKALVGVTETNATDTSANMGSPVIGGVAYQAVAGGASVLGWRSVTWAGAATVNLAAATTGPVYAVSDEIPLTSIARADGGTRPLLHYRTFHDGSVDGNWAFATLSANIRTPAAPMRNRTVQVSNVNSDGIATPSAVMTLSNTLFEAYPIVRHTVPVLSVWGVGDSITANDALVADKLSSWGFRACMDASTPAAPVVWANFGGSGLTASQYLLAPRAALAAGAPAPGVLVVSPCSVNDISTTPNGRIVETMRKLAQDALQLARDYDIPAVIWWPILPYNALNSAGDISRRALNDEMQALALTAGVTWMAISGLGDNATPERWVLNNGFEVAAGSFAASKTYVIKTVGTTDFTLIGAASNVVGTVFVATGVGSGTGTAIDGIHPNEATIESIMAPALTPLLRSFAAM